MRLIDTEIRTVGDLRAALDGTDDSTPIDWIYCEYSCDPQVPTERAGRATVADASTHSATISVDLA